jgi:hypothetical protein
MPTPAMSTTLNFHCRCGANIGLRSGTNVAAETSRSVRDALWAAAHVLGWRKCRDKFDLEIDAEECPSCAAGIEPRAVATGPEPTRED